MTSETNGTANQASPSPESANSHLMATFVRYQGGGITSAQDTPAVLSSIGDMITLQEFNQESRTLSNPIFSVQFSQISKAYVSVYVAQIHFYIEDKKYIVDFSANDHFVLGTLAGPLWMFAERSDDAIEAGISDWHKILMEHRITVLNDFSTRKSLRILALCVVVFILLSLLGFIISVIT